MCARATLKSPERLTELRELRVTFPGGLKPRFNIAPTTPILVARLGSDGAMESSLCRWGLIPSWSGGPKNFKTFLINARCETLTSKPSFREPFKRRRCLVLADGFYEWAHPGDGRKLPYHIHQADDAPFAFAGLWDEWEGPVDEPIQSCTIITAPANGLIRPLHERMPVILNRADYQRWLDPQAKPAALQELLRPLRDDALEMYPVNPAIVNSGRIDCPDCVVPWHGTA
jgi:putative SOS response-associated peptidase YedK